MTHSIEINIPFSGFYHSYHDSELDSVWERECDYFAEDTGCDMPEFLNDAYFDAINWGNVHQEYAREYVESFCEWLEIDGKFSGMESPREYNFQTDRVFAKITRNDVAKLWRKVDKTEFSKLVQERFTSRDGFISHYDNDWHNWGKLSDWDHNQLGTLLLCVANAESSGEFDQSDEIGLMESASCNGCFDDWVWGSSEKATRLINIIDYIRQRAGRSIKTLAQWHAARRMENRPFEATPLGAHASIKA